MQLPEILLKLQSYKAPEGSVEQMYGLMLYGAIRNEHPQVVVEFGTGMGYSTSWMLLGLQENESGHLWSVDVSPTDNPLWLQVGLPTDRLTYFPNDPVETLKNTLPPEFDFVFHDAGHSLEEVQKDLEWILPRLRVRGSIVIHDVTYSKGMGEALLDYFDSRPDEWRYERIEEGCGVGIATRIKQTETDPCKAELSGSTTRKDSGSSQGKTEKTTSPTTPKSSKKRGAKRSKKTRPLLSMRQMKQKGRGQKALSLNGAE